MENINPTPPEPREIKKEKYIIGTVIFILAVAVAYLAWYVNERNPAPSPEPPPTLAPVAEEVAPPPPQTEADVSLGASLFESAQDPIKDKIPENGTPVSNPISGAYKNPFE